jgi:predicted Zn-dependent protease
MVADRCGFALAALGLCAVILPAQGRTPPAAAARQVGSVKPPLQPAEIAGKAAEGSEGAPGDSAAPAQPAVFADPKLEKHSGLNFWSLEREFELGRKLDTTLRANAELVDDPAVAAYLGEVTRRIAGNTAIRLPIQLRVLATSEPDSFSLPGGFLYISAGMVQETESEAELAAVLAHEVAHVSCRHATRQMTEREIFSWASMALMLVGGPVGFGLNEAAFFGFPLTQQKLSRNDETEADALSLHYLVAGGYDPTAAISLFERLASREHRRGARLQRIFLNHPLTRDRLEAINREMRKLPEREDYVVSTSQYEEMQWRLSHLGFKPDTRGPVLLRKTKDSDVQP